MKLFLAVVYVLNHSFVNGQLCTELPSTPMIENDFRSVVNASGQAGNAFDLRDIFYNCITYGSSDGTTFRETRITAMYQIENGTFEGRVLYQCTTLNGTVWVTDGVVLKPGLTENGTDRCMNCRELSPTACTGQHYNSSLLTIYSTAAP